MGIFILKDVNGLDLLSEGN